ncbi:MAG: HyaD/HybD family hydrogenase maturation endopeptidase [Pseudomonadota bacterium]
MKKLLVLGIGNMLLTDEGVGVFAAEALQKETWPENVSIMEAGTFTQDIFYLFEDYDALIVLDILHTNSEPGTIYRLGEDDLVQKESQRLSIHDIDLLDSLTMAELLCGRRPSMRVVGIEPYDYNTWNIGLSEVLQPVFPKFLEAARAEIHDALAKLAASEQA